MLIYLCRKFWLFIQMMAFSNSACNPFIYCVYSIEFRKGFKKIFCWKKEHVKTNDEELKGRDGNKE